MFGMFPTKKSSSSILFGLVKPSLLPGHVYKYAASPTGKGSRCYVTTSRSQTRVSATTHPLHTLTIHTVAQLSSANLRIFFYEITSQNTLYIFYDTLCILWAFFGNNSLNFIFGKRRKSCILYIILRNFPWEPCSQIQWSSPVWLRVNVEKAGQHNKMFALGRT